MRSFRVLFIVGSTCLLSQILADTAKAQQDAKAQDDFKVAKGQITFDAEGNEGGKYHSRNPHVPSNSSGLTIGRGYDMKFRKLEQIAKDLKAAGLDQASAELYAKAAGLSGKAAKAFIDMNKLEEITPAQQKRLFEMEYARMEKDVRRICDDASVIKAYGKVDWDKLHAAIRDVLVDLRYRGDYTPTTRKLIQKHVAENDVDAFAKVMMEKASWSSVPPDRFRRRAERLKMVAKSSD
jgi:hypothetical protein